jgi:ABC-2 type transport system ATP-binding protein
MSRGPAHGDGAGRALAHQEALSLLVLENVSKRYGEKVALSDVSFEVKSGEIFGLLGPNGAGKTTTIRIVMDIVRATSGDVRLFGEPLRREHLDRLAYLPEERGLYAKQKVLDVMVYFGKLKGLGTSEARTRARNWLDRMGLGSTASWQVDRLSKGMMQKVQIASTLLSEPELCVLDEPFSGLDPLNTVLIRDLIAEIRSSGRTAILSTHQMSMVETLCDRVALLSDGKLVVYGDVNEVRRRYSFPDVRVELEGNLPDIPGVKNVVSEGGGRFRLLLENESDSQRVLGAIIDSGAQVVRFERVLASMEDIFIRVVSP